MNTSEQHHQQLRLRSLRGCAGWSGSVKLCLVASPVRLKAREEKAEADIVIVTFKVTYQCEIKRKRKEQQQQSTM